MSPYFLSGRLGHKWDQTHFGSYNLANDVPIVSERPFNDKSIDKTDQQILNDKAFKQSNEQSSSAPPLSLLPADHQYKKRKSVLLPALFHWPSSIPFNNKPVVFKPFKNKIHFGVELPAKPTIASIPPLTNKIVKSNPIPFKLEETKMIAFMPYK